MQWCGKAPKYLGWCNDSDDNDNNNNDRDHDHDNNNLFVHAFVLTPWCHFNWFELLCANTLTVSVSLHVVGIFCGVLWASTCDRLNSLVVKFV